MWCISCRNGLRSTSLDLSCDYISFLIEERFKGRQKEFYWSGHWIRRSALTSKMLFLHSSTYWFDFGWWHCYCHRYLLWRWPYTNWLTAKIMEVMLAPQRASTIAEEIFLVGLSSNDSICGITLIRTKKWTIYSSLVFFKN